MFNFKELKNKTFCIYDIKSEAQGKEVQRILDDELGLGECGRDTFSYKEWRSLVDRHAIDKNKYIFQVCIEPETRSFNYKATATQFLEDYSIWKDLKSVPFGDSHYKQYLGKKYAVHCTTQEEWDMVSNTKGVQKPYIFKGWSEYAEDSHILITGGYGNSKAYKNKDYTILSVAEFFGEEKFVETFTKEEFKESIINKLNKANKFMNTIKRTFQSKETKALNHFNLIEADGTLNEQGRAEFVDFMYETGSAVKKEFIAKIVEAHKEDTK